MPGIALLAGSVVVLPVLGSIKLVRHVHDHAASPARDRRQDRRSLRGPGRVQLTAQRHHHVTAAYPGLKLNAGHERAP